MSGYRGAVRPAMEDWRFFCVSEYFICGTPDVYFYANKRACAQSRSHRYSSLVLLKWQVALSNTLKLALMEKEEWFGISCVSRLQEESQISQKTQKDPGGRCEMHYFKENPSQFISSRPVRPYFIGSRGLATVYQSNYSLCIAAQSYFCDRITTLHQ